MELRRLTPQHTTRQGLVLQQVTVAVTLGQRWPCVDTIPVFKLHHVPHVLTLEAPEPAQGRPPLVPRAREPECREAALQGCPFDAPEACTLWASVLHPKNERLWGEGLQSPSTQGEQEEGGSGGRAGHRSTLGSAAGPLFPHPHTEITFHVPPMAILDGLCPTQGQAHSRCSETAAPNSKGSKR